MIKLELVGVESYVLRGERYEKGKGYIVTPNKAEILLSRKSDNGFPFFRSLGAAVGVPSDVVKAPVRRGRPPKKPVEPTDPVEEQSDMFTEDLPPADNAVPEDEGVAI